LILFYLGRKNCGFKPSKDRYKPQYVFGYLKEIYAVSNPQRIATNPPRPQLISVLSSEFQTLKGSLQTLLRLLLHLLVVAVSNPQRIATNPWISSLSLSMGMFQTLKGSLQTTKRNMLRGHHKKCFKPSKDRYKLRECLTEAVREKTVSNPQRIATNLLAPVPLDLIEPVSNPQRIATN